MPANTSQPVRKEKSASIGKTFGLVAILTVFSKVAGFIRDIVVASAFGTGPLADAYNYAYLFTGNILILFGGLGGPFHSSTVAVLAREKDKPASGLLMAQVIASTTVILGLVSLVVYCLAPHLMHILLSYNSSGGYKGTDLDLLLRESILQLRWMSPLILIAGLIGVVYGILNVYNRVAWPSISPAIASLAIIIALSIDKDRSTSLPLAIATLVGAGGQFTAQLPDLFRCRLPWRFSFKPTPELRHYLSMLWPACLGTLVGQITIYVDSFFCAQIGPGGLTSINNANRLVQLPLGILTTAMLVPMLPRFSELVHTNDIEGLKNDYVRALRFMIFLSLPVAALLLALPKPIVHGIFQRGQFNANSTNLVSAALLWQAPCIAFYVGRDLITRIFYAMRDTKTPYYVAMVAIVVKACLDWLVVVKFKEVASIFGLDGSQNYFHYWQVGGMSLATTLITVLNLALLTFALRQKIGQLGFVKAAKPLSAMLISGAICGVVSFASFVALMQLSGHANTQIDSLGWQTSVCFVTISCAVGALTYFLGCVAFKLEELQMLKRRMPPSVIRLLKLDDR